MDDAEAQAVRLVAVAKFHLRIYDLVKQQEAYRRDRWNRILPWRTPKVARPVLRRFEDL